MATTTSAKAARKAARESALEANAALARRTKLNVDDLTTFFASMSRAENVEDWLNEKIAALKEQAAKRRDAERRQAGVALGAMRERGEQVRDIARLARISGKQVRELIRLGEATPASQGEALDATAMSGQLGGGDGAGTSSGERVPAAPVVGSVTVVPESTSPAPVGG
jgi:hypothetical protein